ncbi:MAG: aminopeptidase P family protein [Verrucomicrobia bacterium]|nr:aminopeptidase P family protein [Verrucomicrobiota bacterium]MBI3868234.1 aminopeptidase P family protein [Verrucomicrobiota bacterium]
MSENLLIFADSEHDANMLYAVRMFVPDPFVFLRLNGKSIVVMSDLELDRARREASSCRVVSASSLIRRLTREGVRNPDTATLIRYLLGQHGARKVLVPENFPLGLAKRLQKLGVKVKTREGSFFPERERKHADEVKKISAALTMAEVGLAEAIQALRNSRAGRNRRLIYRNAPLTSERLQGIVAIAVFQAGGVAANTIVAGGAQACDPHERGHGVLRAGEPIIVDVFPRSQKTGYFGDITRTIVKGRADESVRQIYRAVEEAQALAFGLLRSGARANTVHSRVHEHFEALGYKTRKHRGRMQGFFHGTGHGLGLEVHERLRIGWNSSDTLQEGHVVTVEPGLYYPGVGGVRLEDVALVTKTGARNLTRFEKLLEL